MSAVAIIDYTNHRNERRVRRICPWALVFKESPYHKGKQWILEATDLEDEAVRVKDFAMEGIHSWTASCVSDEQPKAEDPKGLSPQGASATRESGGRP